MGATTNSTARAPHARFSVNCAWFTQCHHPVSFHSVISQCRLTGTELLDKHPAQIIKAIGLPQKAKGVVCIQALCDIMFVTAGKDHNSL